MVTSKKVTLVVFGGFEKALRLVPGPSAIQYCTRAMLRFNAVLLTASAVGTTNGRALEYPIQYKSIRKMSKNFWTFSLFQIEKLKSKKVDIAVYT